MNSPSHIGQAERAATIGICTALDSGFRDAAVSGGSGGKS